MAQRRTPSGQGPSGGRARDRGTGTRAPSRRPTRTASAQPSIGIRTGAATEVRTEATRSATRPATARRATAPGAARRTSAPGSKRLTGRAAALGLVLLALMLAYAYPVRLYLAQEAQIQDLQTSQALQRARINNLASQSAEWNDPAYIKAQARARFFMVPPGTKTYVVQAAPPPPVTPTASASTAPWYGQLWTNVTGADNPVTPQ